MKTNFANESLRQSKKKGSAPHTFLSLIFSICFSISKGFLGLYKIKKNFLFSHLRISLHNFLFILFSLKRVNNENHNFRTQRYPYF